MIVDPASESSFITESLVQELKLPRRKYSVDIVGVGSAKLPNNRGCVSCKITPRHTFSPTLSVEAMSYKQFPPTCLRFRWIQVFAKDSVVFV